MSSHVFDLAEVEAFLDSLQIKANQQLAAKPDDPALLLASRLEPMRKMAIIELLRFINERPMTAGRRSQTMRFDMLDYPTAWEIQKSVGAQLHHGPRCSAVPGHDPISGPSFLCDCGAITLEWERRRADAQDACPGHVASELDPKICGRCGIHVDSLRPDEE